VDEGRANLSGWVTNAVKFMAVQSQ
jgi:hypothetical protein